MQLVKELICLSVYKKSVRKVVIWQQKTGIGVSDFVKRWYVIACFLLFSALARAQVLSYFTAQNLGDRVFLNWEIRAGSICNGIDVERSEDGLNYTKIGDIQGVCGSPDFHQKYNYTDANPVAGAINSYRLILGTLGTSDTVEVRIRNNADTGIEIAPNPLTMNSVLFLPDSYHNGATIQVFNVQGGIVLTEKISGVSWILGSYLPDFASGIYLVRITGTSGISSTGRFIVVAP